MDPLVCPDRGGPMRFLAVIDEAPVIERILRHVGVGCEPRGEMGRFQLAGRALRLTEPFMAGKLA